jgi:VTC domain
MPTPSPAVGEALEASVGEAAVKAVGISLAELVARAALQVRLERKYLVAAAEFVRLAVRLEGELEALDIDGRRSFAYESNYFDTPSLLTYREHLAGCSDRFKLRTRSYLDSGETMFEVKLERPGGGTMKRRASHLFDDRNRITPDARRHLAAALAEAGRSVPRALGPSLVVAYRRTTFVLRDGSARITCDRDLVCSHGGQTVTGLSDHVLVEVKSAGATSVVDRMLEELRVEPVSISKYCVGLALLHPELPCGPWDALLERYFGRPPALAAA